MNCTCPACSGTGHIRCLDCNGEGVQHVPIQHARLDPTEPTFAELKTLKDSACFVLRAAAELSAMRPQFAHRYQADCLDTLKRIEDQVAAVLKTKGLK